MNTDSILLKEEAFRVVGAAFEVLNTLGHGLHEKPHENALVVEFSLAKIPFEQQLRFPVIYKTVQVSEYVPDLIAFGTVIVDPKVIDRITNHESGQMLKLPAHYRAQSGADPEFQTGKARMGKVGSLLIIRVNSRPFAVKTTCAPLRRVSPGWLFARAGGFPPGRR
jgi:GxxExxY protein